MKRAKHNLSNYKLATMNMGQLVPVACIPVVRGDSFRHATSCLTRMSPMLAPVMHPIHQKIHHWFVPNRINWVDWENFITGGPDGTSTPTHPTITINNAAVGSLADYLGIPPLVAQNRSVSALPFRAYARIWNEYYRDQDLQTELPISTASGVDSTTNTTLQNAAWMKDYFTTARPEPQKGPEVVLPLAGEAPVLGIGKFNQNFSAPASGVYESDGQTANYANAAPISDTSHADQTFYVEGDAATGGYPQIRADLALAEGPNVNDVRLALALQRFKEARAKFGSKYVDYLAFYGIKSSDARLQRPEYLGGGRQTIQISEVLQTSPDQDAGDSELFGVGELYGHGIGAMKTNKYDRFFEEDGYIISVMVTNPVTMYVQGIPRHFSCTVKEDYFQKELAHIGQEQIKYKEVYSAHSDPEGTFGWQDRYDWLRRIENTIAGEFRSTLNFWGLWRIFGSDPALNADFVKSNPTNRVFADQTVNQLQCMIRHNITARRIVPKFGDSFIY